MPSGDGRRSLEQDTVEIGFTGFELLRGARDYHNIWSIRHNTDISSSLGFLLQILTVMSQYWAVFGLNPSGTRSATRPSSQHIVTDKSSEG
jgi:hypothetical protein